MPGHHVLMGQRNDLSPAHLAEMYSLRHRVFRERLGWQLPDAAGLAQQELDEYDHCNPTYVILRRQGRAFASCRLLPTVGRWMLPDLWPEMLCGNPAPCSPQVWELSRFAVDASENGGPAIGAATAMLLDAAYTFAIREGIERYVVVTGAAMERLLRKTGLNMHRLGAPVHVEGRWTVANEVAIDEITRHAIAAALPYPEQFERHASLNRREQLENVIQ